jgi:hypothetical protein
MFYSFQNDLGLAIMVGVFLKCGTLSIRPGGASFNLLNIITTKKFQHLFVVVSENFEAFF